MKEIILHNKIFQQHISKEEIDNIVSDLANKINVSNTEKPLFIAVLNGSFLFAADIMRKITIANAEISFIKLSSYEGMKSSGEISELIGINSNISNRNIILLEDIIDTGNTLEKIIEILTQEQVGSIKVATLLFKPDAYKKNLNIDFIGKSIENDFVVGYGLDYDEIGRNLPHIYKLKN
ncbi:MAG: hypoxanthine phosphoribosyltransferase [Flavobacteriales bacterium]|nr:hypoxanthine phosphoribosyltransferase [Flavobacteriales bacterium]|tara:strand:+ start:97 stop:633 length:537 start_codon:yes stop_codon:yes gene_type:complete